MKSLHKVHFYFFSIIWVLSFFAYPFADLIAVEERIINFTVYFSLLIVNMIFIVILYAVMHQRMSWSSTFKIVGLIFMLQSIVSILLNSPVEWLPTFSRYLLYITTFTIFYLGFKSNNIKLSSVSLVVMVLSSIIVFSGFYELLSGSVRFVNGAYRVAGNFTDHHLGFALSAFVLITYLQYVSFNKLNLLRFIMLILLFWIFILSHSRLLLIALFLANLFINFYLNKRLLVKISYLVFSLLFGVLFVLVVLYTDLLPRMKELFLVSELDASSMYRVFIIQQSIINLSVSDFLIGIGLGGFNEFFFHATGESGVAAHNDYLLMLVEGGILGLILYLYYQYKVTMTILRSSLRDQKIVKLVFVLFFGIEVIGFLENAHYFYQSELLIFIMLSYFYAKKEQEDSILPTK